MRATNLTLAAVELDPVNGPGLLLPADEDSDGGHVRDLAEVTDREKALEAAGTIALDGEPTRDRYDDMEREALDAEISRREMTVERADGRTDRPVPLGELRTALRLHDTTGGDQ